MTTPSHPHEIRTTVTFAAAPAPYQHNYPPVTTAATVVTDALAVFGIPDDGADRYYLFHDGREVPPEETVGHLAGHAQVLHVSLRTQTVSG